ncbi:hypothetical protein [Merismopedia glauca]|nr:hypothetical protein [Merismopedia glauca]
MNFFPQDKKQRNILIAIAAIGGLLLAGEVSRWIARSQQEERYKAESLERLKARCEEEKRDPGTFLIWCPELEQRLKNQKS